MDYETILVLEEDFMLHADAEKDGISCRSTIHPSQKRYMLEGSSCLDSQSGAQILGIFMKKNWLPVLVSS